MYTINIDILTNDDPEHVISKIREIHEIDIKDLSWSAFKHKKSFNVNDWYKRKRRSDIL